MAFSMYDPKLLEGVRTIHFIGCGGSGTYPLIQILHSRGFAITGSDVEETKNTEAERALGVRVAIGHDAANLGNPDLVVYSAAIHNDNPELQAAHARGIKAVERSVMLGYISRTHSQSVGVAGTHGKTTTTGMITTMLELAGKDPAAVIGGKLPLINGYGKAGKGDDIVIEACEYSETFLKLTPYLSVVLNIDNDHLDYYGSM
ncbi:Mur ligase domain-containing protein, partial [Gemmiger sp.]|uniref:Mur ligase domain-containing protein n=1 Tax=Gemmiger sp. TaxID=2049027 RepID=UPI003A9161DF